MATKVLFVPKKRQTNAKKNQTKKSVQESSTFVQFCMSFVSPKPYIPKKEKRVTSL